MDFKVCGYSANLTLCCCHGNVFPPPAIKIAAVLFGDLLQLHGRCEEHCIAFDESYVFYFPLDYYQILTREELVALITNHFHLTEEEEEVGF